MKKIILISGAGVSRESNIATFRDANGTWAKHDMSKVCDIDTWQANYELVHEFYNDRRAEIKSAQPNAFHYAVADWEKRYPLVNITQNIDDLFERAGCRSVVHLHGRFQDMRCRACGHEFEIYGSFSPEAGCPRCPAKKSAVKPAVIFFGENAPNYRTLNRELRDTRGAIVVIAGTAEQVLPLGTWLKNAPGYKVCVNPANPMSETYDEYVKKVATESIDQLDEIFTRLMSPGK